MAGRKKRMTKQELIKKLKKAAQDDTESAHATADGLLLEYINDKEIAEAYNAFDKWYA